MNAAVELHDSQVVAIEPVAGGVAVRLAAYVHRSAGRPGYDAGTGWAQPVTLAFAGGVVEERPAELPCTLDDGAVSGGLSIADGMVPLPAAIRAAVRFEAAGLYGERLAVRADGLEVVPAGDTVYVESFSGMGS